MLGKKGQLAPRFIIPMIVALVVGVGAFAFYGRVYAPVMHADTERELCRTSVEAKNIKLEILGIDVFKNPLELSCPTRDIVLREDGIEIDRSFKKFEDISGAEEMIKERIMQEMEDCWYSFGAGWDKVLEQERDGKQSCVICAEITTSDEFTGKYGTITLNNMYTYAKEHFRGFSETESYLDFFLSGADMPSGWEDQDAMSITLAPDKKYAVVFAILTNDDTMWFDTFDTDDGIIGCQSGSDKAGGSSAKKIGCNTGLVVGKVLPGWTKKFGPIKMSEGLDYPTTVRLQQISELDDQCDTLN